jgi:hypothetical protein
MAIEPSSDGYDQRCSSQDELDEVYGTHLLVLLSMVPANVSAQKDGHSRQGAPSFALRPTADTVALSHSN